MNFIPIRPSDQSIPGKLGVGMWVMPINQLQDFYDYSKQEHPRYESGSVKESSVECSDIDCHSDVFGLY